MDALRNLEAKYSYRRAPTNPICLKSPLSKSLSRSKEDKTSAVRLTPLKIIESGKESLRSIFMYSIIHLLNLWRPDQRTSRLSTVYCRSLCAIRTTSVCRARPQSTVSPSGPRTEQQRFQVVIKLAFLWRRRGSITRRSK